MREKRNIGKNNRKEGVFSKISSSNNKLSAIFKYSLAIALFLILASAVLAGDVIVREGDIETVNNLTDGTNFLSIANANAAYIHTSSTGENHTYIDQDVTTSANPLFDTVKLNGTGGNVLELIGRNCLYL